MKINFEKWSDAINKAFNLIDVFIVRVSPFMCVIALCLKLYLIAIAAVGMLIWSELSSIRKSLQVFVDEIELDNETEINHE